MNMEGDVHITNKLTEEQLEKGCDVLVINRFSFYNEAQEIYDWRDKYKFKLVVDIDDYWELNSGHILYENWSFNNIPNIIVQNLIKADLVTVTHERLAEYASAFNKNIHILPNAIPGGFEQFLVQKEQSDFIRIMWQGSITHRADVEILRNPIKRIASDSILKEKLQMVFGGHVRHLTDSDAMLSAFTNGLKLNPKIFNGMKPTEYYQIYNHADICVVPLVDNRFNSFKSNLKVLEAAYAGIPVIASHVNPYLGFPEDVLLYAKRQSDWYANVKDLASISYFRHMAGKNLMEYCNKHYNFKEINLKRKEIYESK
jgi:glycosyltransferase involved in cell wall biosynthesis